MIIKDLRLSFAIVCLISATAGLLMSNSVLAGEKATLQLTKLLNATNGLSARFHQEAINAEGQALQQTQGEMKLQRPGKFYWYTQQPFEQKINSDGKRIWVYDIDLEQVSIQDVDPGLGQTPAALLSGDPEKVVIQFYVDGSREPDGNWYFNLTPKKEGGLFSGLSLRFNGNKLVYMKLIDNIGQTTTVRFADVRLNPTFDSNDFMLRFPEGVDIIDSSQQ